MFARLRRSSALARRSKAHRPVLEGLENRIALSWSAVPPSSVSLSASADDHTTINSFGSAGGFSATASITRNEVDYFKFTALRTGRYTFDAKASNSQIDTVSALYDSSGRRLGYNDDANSHTNNSNFSVSLNAGSTYSLGITNYTGSSKGAYSVQITPATLYINQNVSRSGVSTYGDATLTGTNLHLSLNAINGSNLNVVDHTITVQLLDINGRPVHTGSFVRSTRTAGRYVPGTPATRNLSFDIDVSYLDLSKVSRLYIQVSQN